MRKPPAIGRSSKGQDRPEEDRAKGERPRLRWERPVLRRLAASGATQQSKHITRTDNPGQAS